MRVREAVVTDAARGAGSYHATAGHARTLFPERTFGLYSAFLACSAISLRSRRQPRFTVATTFCRVGTIPDGCTVRSTTATAWASMDGGKREEAKSAVSRSALLRVVAESLWGDR